MAEPASTQPSTGRSIGRTVVAALILIVVGWFLLHIIIGIATAIAGFVVVILAIVAVIWALRTIF
jgi:hypothetical protein